MLTASDILGFIGKVYLLTVLFFLILALWLPKGWVAKIAWSVVVLVLFLAWPAVSIYEEHQKIQEFQTRHQAAKAIFDKHCQKAGVKIYKTAEDVEGIFLMKLRLGYRNFENQYELDDPYGDDAKNEEYIHNFLRERDERGYLYRPEGGPYYRQWKVVSNGYHYVELIHPQTGERMRYEARKLLRKRDSQRRKDWETAPCEILTERDDVYPNYTNYVSCPVPLSEPGPRYGVTYDDISTREDRDYWIAGSSLRVIDLETGEVMAERIGYMMDPGQGSRGGGRNPWLEAADYACPPFPRSNGRASQGSQTRNFVEQVLKPKQYRNKEKNDEHG